MNWNWAIRSQKCRFLDCRDASIVIRLALRPVPFGAPRALRSGGAAQVVDTRRLMGTAVPLGNLPKFGFSLVNIVDRCVGVCYYNENVL